MWLSQPLTTKVRKDLTFQIDWDGVIVTCLLNPDKLVVVCVVTSNAVRMWLENTNLRKWDSAQNHTVLEQEQNVAVRSPAPGFPDKGLQILSRSQSLVCVKMQRPGPPASEIFIHLVWSGARTTVWIFNKTLRGSSAGGPGTTLDLWSVKVSPTSAGRQASESSQQRCAGLFPGTWNLLWLT